MDDYGMEGSPGMDGYGQEDMEHSGMVEGQMMEEDYGDEEHVSVTNARLTIHYL
jgi:hypothetical protein